MGCTVAGGGGQEGSITGVGGKVLLLREKRRRGGMRMVVLKECLLRGMQGCSRWIKKRCSSAGYLGQQTKQKKDVGGIHWAGEGVVSKDRIERE